MSRGQLTYYFPSKEDILLAVFDRVLQLMCARNAAPSDTLGQQASGWDWVQRLLQKVVAEPPRSRVSCVYIFLSSRPPRIFVSVWRPYEELRTDLAQFYLMMLRPRIRRCRRALATLVRALLHDLTMQAADPGGV